MNPNVRYLDDLPSKDTAPASLTVSPPPPDEDLSPNRPSKGSKGMRGSHDNNHKILQGARGTASLSDDALDPDEDYDDNEHFDEEGEADEDVQLGFLEPLEEGAAGDLLFRCADWHTWDGGKVGGRPIWLNPRDLPPPAAVACPTCGGPMPLLLQIYCPIDEITTAFHRALYVFCCRKAACVEVRGVRVLRCQLPRDNPFYSFEPDDDNDGGTGKGGGGSGSGSNNGNGRVARNCPEAWGAKLCAVCGCRGDARCTRCSDAHYCGREHQVAHWRGGHRAACRPVACDGGGDGEAAVGVAAMARAIDVATSEAETVKKAEQRTVEAAAASAESSAPQVSTDAAAGTAAITAPKPTAAAALVAQLFPEFEIVVEPERDLEQPPRDAVAAAAAAAAAEAVLREKLEGVAIEDAEESRTDEDRHLTQAELDRMTGAAAAKDPRTLAFLARVGGGGGGGLGGEEGGKGAQVLRYARWGAGRPLWCSSAGLPPGEEAAPAKAAAGAANAAGATEAAASFPPPCERCGAPRRFEAQVMPQLLHYLRVESGAAPAAAAARLAQLQIENRSWRAGGDGGDGARGLFATKTSIDWGVLTIYTCTASCDVVGPAAIVAAGATGEVSAGGVSAGTRAAVGATAAGGGEERRNAYAEEYVWRQPPLDW